MSRRWPYRWQQCCFLIVGLLNLWLASKLFSEEPILALLSSLLGLLFLMMVIVSMRRRKSSGQDDPEEFS